MKSIKLLAAGIAAITAISAMSIPSMAEESVSMVNNLTETADEVTVYADAPVGTEYDLGNGVVYKVIDHDTYDKLTDIVDSLQQARTKRYSWSIPYLSRLNKKTYDTTFSLKGNYVYWHVAMCNNQATNYYTTLSVLDPDGNFVNSVKVYGGGTNGNLGWIYSTSPYSTGTYTVRFSSSTALLNGNAQGFAADQASDVIYDG